MRPIRSVLVTGAGGFVGRHLLPLLSERGYGVRPATRATIGEIGPATDWREALAGIDAVIHLAARVHVMREAIGEAAAEDAYDRVNRAGTARLAEAAAEAGVRRLVFLSSVKVNGEATAATPFRADDEPRPEDAYGRSKLAAEQALAAIAASGKLEVVALRPPLVYGPGVGANFRALLRLCDTPWPLPLGAVDNRRSLLFVGNLADAVERSLAAEARGGFAVHLLRDGEDLSTTALVRQLRKALGRADRLVAVPPPLLAAAARLAGKAAIADRLLLSLQVDDTSFRRDFGWSPPITATAGLAATARWHRELGKNPR